MSIQVQTRINKKLRDDLQKIATEQFEGNLSMVVRLALKQFRDSHCPNGAKSTDPDWASKTP